MSIFYSVQAAFPRFDANKNGELQKEEWEAGQKVVASLATEHGLLAVKRGGSGDVTRTHVAWKETRSIPEVPTPLAYRNRIYIIRNGGILTCLDAVTGKLVYRGRVGAASAFFASPVVANGRLIVASGEGVVVVLGTDDHLEVLARNDLGESISATPAVVGGVLYVRTVAHLFAFGQK